MTCYLCSALILSMPHRLLFIPLQDVYELMYFFWCQKIKIYHLHLINITSYIRKNT
ncbi:hypothetical protein GEI7407_2803 [Geitlerinema sp. PCC 7407]|nr:hypothetical protein GEI7407_2803 [Geitlerinema sp. PCC 7407]